MTPAGRRNDPARGLTRAGPTRYDRPMLLDILWKRTWWQYGPGDRSGFSTAYLAFNLAEGASWLVFAALVLHRRRQGRRSALELWYALAFFTFGLTDFREAYALTSWLIWLKLANLIVLARLRAEVIRRSYPTSKLY